MALDPNTAQQQSQSAVVSGLKPTLTLAALAAVFAAALVPVWNTFSGMGTWVSGVYRPNIPNGTITQAMLSPNIVVGGGGNGSAALVPSRVISSTGAAPTTTTDYIVVLNGPNEVDLEQSPPYGTTHVLIDGRAKETGSISIVSAYPDTINNAPSILFTQTAQAMTVTYTPLGWKYY